MRNTDFFDQITDFIQWYSQLWMCGVKKPVDLLDWFKETYETLSGLLSGFVHPYFMAIFAFAICVALVHKIFRFESKG